MLSYRLFNIDGSIDGGVAEDLQALCSALNSVDEDATLVLICPEDVAVGAEAIKEMAEASSLLDRHGVICARIISSSSSANDADTVSSQWEQFAQSMPRYSLEWRPRTTCVLIKCVLIRTLGGFDSSYETFIGCLWDFAFRVNDFGYSTLLDNKVCAVREAASVSKAEWEDRSPSAADLLKLKNRFECFFDMGLNYKADVFYDLVQGEWDNRERRSSILFEFSTMDDFYCGTSEYQVAMLRYFSRLYSDKYVLRARCNAAAIEFHGLMQFENVELYLPDEEVPISDIGIIAAQPLMMHQQRFASEHCARIVYTMLDCILTRSGYLAEGFPERVDLIRLGLRNADGAITISEFSQNDYRSFFDYDDAIRNLPSCVAYLASDFGDYQTRSSGGVNDSEEIPFDDFALVIGNAFRHKALQNTIDAVAGTDVNYLVVGDGCSADGVANVHRIDGMRLSERFLVSLYKKSRCIVFPSQYEGFGLPVAIALKFGKKIVLHDNDVNRELHNRFSEHRESFIFFKTFEEIPILVGSVGEDDAVSEKKFERSWLDVILDIEPFIASLLNTPLDWKHIENRVWSYKLVEGQMEDTARCVYGRNGFKRLFKRLVRERLFGKKPEVRELDEIGL